MARASQTASIREGSLELDSFLTRDMVEVVMEPDEAAVWRSQRCLEVTVHASSTQEVSIEDIEEMHKQQKKVLRTTIPSQDILVHHSSLPLSMTAEDGLNRLHNKFNSVIKPKAECLNSLLYNIELEIDKVNKKEKTEKDSSAEIVAIAFPSVCIGKGSEKIKSNLEREILNTIQVEPADRRKQVVMEVLSQFLMRGVELFVLNKNPETKKLWGALNNRQGQIAENETAFALNQELQHLQGFSVMGMKTHSCLSSFLEKVGIKLTHRNEVDPDTGQTWINEAEHDYFSSWSEEKTVVINVVQTKLLEERPWMISKQAKRTRDTISHALQCFKQLKKDFRTFKEIFPDLSPDDFSKIRYVKVRTIMH